MKKTTFFSGLVARGDLSAFWALFADNLANIVIVTTTCTTVFGMPGWIVFGRIVPGLGVALLVGLTAYVLLARRLAKRERRKDVTALPYGISTPVMFVYLFGVIGPVYWKSGNPVLAWQVGVAAAFIGGIIEACGAIFGPWLKRVTPRAGMLGTLAGIALVWIATHAFAIIIEKPLIGFPSLIIVLLGLVAGMRLPWRFPPGLLAIGVGTGIAFVTGDASFDFSGITRHLPVPVIGDLLSGLRHIGGFLNIVLPIEIYNFIETMNNVESAEAAGDRYPVGICQVIDGIGTVTGSLFGAAFPTTVYIGHPAYKRLGGRSGYAFATGAVIFIAACTGLIAFLQSLIPIAAVAPMLCFVGLVITAQAFTVTPRPQAIGVAAAIIPHIAAIGYGKMQSLLSTLNISLDEALLGTLSADHSLQWCGLQSLSHGTIIIGLLWGAIVALLAGKKYGNAALFAGAAALLSGTGFIHAGSLTLQWHSPLFHAYLAVAVILAIAHLGKNAGKTIS